MSQGSDDIKVSWYNNILLSKSTLRYLLEYQRKDKYRGENQVQSVLIKQRCSSSLKFKHYNMFKKVPYVCISSSPAVSA